MATKQILGTEQSLSKSPVSSPSGSQTKPTAQLVGTSKDMSRTAIPSPSSDPKGGSYQIIGGEAKLNRTPVKGWGSAASLPMSPRAIAQSQIKRGKRK